MKNKEEESMQIGLQIRKVPEELFKEIDSLIGILEKNGAVKVAKKSVRRICDNCNKEIKTGEKFKGSGIEEFCSHCTASNKVKGAWKTNDY